MESDGDRREGLVDLDGLQVAQSNSCKLGGPPDGVGRLVEQRGVGTGDRGVRQDLRLPGQAQFLGPRPGRQDERHRAVVQGGGVPGGEHPAFRERRPKRRKGFQRRLPRSFVGVHHAPAGRHGRDLTGPRGGVLGGLLLGTQRELVLRGPGEARFARVPFGRRTHRDALVGVGEPVEGGVVEHGHLAVLEPAPRLRQQVRRAAHRLHTARDHEIAVARAQEPVGDRDRGQPREAHLVHGETRYVHGDPARDGRLPGRILARPRREHMPHDDLPDQLGRDAGPFKGGPDRDAAQSRRGDLGESPVEPAHRGPGGGEDDGGLGAVRGSHSRIVGKPRRESHRRHPHNSLPGYVAATHCTSRPHEARWPATSTILGPPRGPHLGR
jgi:hypothetical protein